MRNLFSRRGNRARRNNELTHTNNSQYLILIGLMTAVPGLVLDSLYAFSAQDEENFVSQTLSLKIGTALLVFGMSALLCGLKKGYDESSADEEALRPLHP